MINTGNPWVFLVLPISIHLKTYPLRYRYVLPMGTGMGFLTPYISTMLGKYRHGYPYPCTHRFFIPLTLPMDTLTCVPTGFSYLLLITNNGVYTNHFHTPTL